VADVGRGVNPGAEVYVSYEHLIGHVRDMGGMALGILGVVDFRGIAHFVEKVGELSVGILQIDRVFECAERLVFFELCDFRGGVVLIRAGSGAGGSHRNALRPGDPAAERLPRLRRVLLLRLTR